jgi:hypothetical protein
MASVPNTHAVLFTNLPDGISKQWKSEILDVASNTVTDQQHSRHSITPIHTVTLTIEFNKLVTPASGELTREDDTQTDLIEAWKEARNDFAALEKAVTESVNTIVAQARTRALKSQSGTTEVLTNVATSPINTHAVHKDITYRPSYFQKRQGKDLSAILPPTGYAETINSHEALYDPSPHAQGPENPHNTKNKNRRHRAKTEAERYKSLDSNLIKFIKSW